MNSFADMHLPRTICDVRLRAGDFAPVNDMTVARRIRRRRFAPRVRTAQRLARRQPFRAKAYARAADNLLALSLPLDQSSRRTACSEIPGIGDAIADIIKKLHATGTHPALEKMRKEIPAGVLEMLTIPGLRADKVIKLYKGARNHSLAGWKRPRGKDACKRSRASGQAPQTKILQGLAMRREVQGRASYASRGRAFKIRRKVHLEKAMPDIIRVTPAGDFRRGCELSVTLPCRRSAELARRIQNHPVRRTVDRASHRRRALRHHAAACDRFECASRGSARTRSQTKHDP